MASALQNVFIMNQLLELEQISTLGGSETNPRISLSNVTIVTLYHQVSPKDPCHNEDIFIVFYCLDYWFLFISIIDRWIKTP